MNKNNANCQRCSNFCIPLYLLRPCQINQLLKNEQYLFILAIWLMCEYNLLILLTKNTRKHIQTPHNQLSHKNKPLYAHVNGYPSTFVTRADIGILWGVFFVSLLLYDSYCFENPFQGLQMSCSVSSSNSAMLTLPTLFCRSQHHHSITIMLKMFVWL